MVALAEWIQPEKTAAPAKNRVGDFFASLPDRVGENPSQVVEPHREKPAAPVGPASGLPCWLSRDPIGERGGVNLYGMLGNDAINLIDQLGLAELIHGTSIANGVRVINEGLKVGGSGNIWMAGSDAFVPRSDVNFRYNMNVNSVRTVPCKVIEEALQRGRVASKGASAANFGFLKGSAIHAHINNWISQQSHGVWRIPTDSGGRVLSGSSAKGFQGYHYAFRSASAWRGAKPVLIRVTGSGADAVIKALRSQNGAIVIQGRTAVFLRGASKALLPIAAGIDTFRFLTAENKAKTAVSIAGGWAGAWIGAKSGAIIGGGGALVGGQAGPQVALPEEIITVPLGGLIGSIVGGIGGYLLGSEVTETTYEWFFEDGYDYSNL